MKTMLAIAFASIAVVSSAAALSTNFVVYTDFHCSTNTGTHRATRLSLEIRDGLIVGCRNEGVFDLDYGVPADMVEQEEAKAKRKAEERRKQREAMSGNSFEEYRKKRERQDREQLTAINAEIDKATSKGDTKRVEELVPIRDRLKKRMRVRETNMQRWKQDDEDEAALRKIVDSQKK